MFSDVRTSRIIVNVVSLAALLTSGGAALCQNIEPASAPVSVNIVDRPLKVEEVKGASGKGLISKDVINQTSRSTVVISVSREGDGSGFFYKYKNSYWILSNCHVIGMASDAQALNVHDQNGIPVPLTSEVMADLDGDIAMIRIADTFHPESYLVDGPAPAVGDSVLAAGNAKGDGIIYPLEGEVKGMGSLFDVPILEMSAKVVPGCSGGPVVNKRGELLGIVTYMVTAPEEKDGGHMLKDTPFFDTRRMAVRASRVSQAQPGKLMDLYLYTRASKDRINLFTLYIMSRTANDPSEIDWRNRRTVSQLIDRNIREADQPVLKANLAGVHRSGYLDEYYKALRCLQNAHDNSSIKSEKDFLTLLKKRLPGSAVDRKKQDYIDQAIADRLAEL